MATCRRFPRRIRTASDRRATRSRRSPIFGFRVSRWQSRSDRDCAGTRYKTSRLTAVGAMDYIPIILLIEGRLPEDVPKAEQPLLRTDIGQARHRLERSPRRGFACCVPDDAAKRSTQFAKRKLLMTPPGRHYDRPARSSLTDDPDIMPGDEKRGRHRQEPCWSAIRRSVSRKDARARSQSPAAEPRKPRNGVLARHQAPCGAPPPRPFVRRPPRRFQQ